MRIPLILTSLLLASCSYLETPVLSPYKMDIRQGNYVTPEMREKLKLGMTKSQVRYVMGTPMLSDAFHDNRWDYPYSLTQHGALVEKQHMTLYFDGDKLVRVVDDGKIVAEVAAMAQQPVGANQSPADAGTEVLRRVEAWAAAWSSRDARNYLASYAPDYAPQGMTRAEWEAQSLARLSKPGVIEIGLSELRVNVSGDHNATASFVQNARFDSVREALEKRLHLVKLDGVWLIADERAGRLPGAEAPAAAGGDAAVRAAITRWVEAWSARDQTRYLASYADSFKPYGMSRAGWEKQRRERIGKAGFISIEVSELNIEMRDATHARATFLQRYRSDSYQDSTRKTLELVKAGDVWLIAAEQAAK